MVLCAILKFEIVWLAKSIYDNKDLEQGYVSSLKTGQLFNNTSLERGSCCLEKVGKETYIWFQKDDKYFLSHHLCNTYYNANSIQICIS